MYKKVLGFLENALNEDNWFWKEENDAIYKRKVRIVWKDKNLLHLQEKFQLMMKTLMIKINYKVKDHYNYTSKYRDVAHNIFNLKYSIPKYIPAFFHNRSNYDYHFIIK